MALVVIGVAAASCASTMAIPQAWRCIRSRPSDGVSPLTWYLIIANASLWIVWGGASHDYIAGIPSLVTLPAASIVVVRSHLSRKERPMPDLHTLMTGIAMGGSPRWHDERLWFADWGVGEIIAVDLDGVSEVVLRRQSLPLSIDWLPDRRLLLVSGRDGLLLRREHDGSLVTHADLSRISNMRWNDIVADGRGNAYVGSIGFDFPGGEFAPGSLALVTPDGSAREVAEGLAFPNGLAVTADNRTLIVAESYGDRLTAFDIGSDGTLSNRRVGANVPGDHPDGICLDADNALWYADVGGRHYVRVREGGDVLQRVDVDLGCFACMLGGREGRTLFIVANAWPLPSDMRAEGAGPAGCSRSTPPLRGRDGHEWATPEGGTRGVTHGQGSAHRCLYRLAARLAAAGLQEGA